LYFERNDVSCTGRCNFATVSGGQFHRDPWRESGICGGRGRVIVLRSASSKIGEWFREIVSVYEDYKNLFGEEPGKVQGVGILSSSDLTQSLAIADYDDFILLP
jgi:Protein of unknown function (DUF3047)